MNTHRSPARYLHQSPRSTSLQFGESRVRQCSSEREREQEISAERKRFRDELERLNEVAFGVSLGKRQAESGAVSLVKLQRLSKHTEHSGAGANRVPPGSDHAGGGLVQIAVGPTTPKNLTCETDFSISRQFLSAGCGQPLLQLPHDDLFAAGHHHAVNPHHPIQPSLEVHVLLL